jgi:hypothetical protein
MVPHAKAREELLSQVFCSLIQDVHLVLLGRVLQALFCIDLLVIQSHHFLLALATQERYSFEEI